MATYKNNLLFEYLKNILQEKSLDKYRLHVKDSSFTSSFVPYMVIRYLSMSKNSEIRNFILSSQSSLQKMSSENLYLFLLRSLPRQTSSYIQYIKG